MFDYELPEQRIAQRALEDRSASKMLVAQRGKGQAAIDSCVRELPAFLAPGDLLVLNNSKVLPCRFFGRKLDSDASIEVLLLRPLEGGDSTWECLAKPMKRLKPGNKVRLSRSLVAEAGTRSGEGEDRIELHLESPRGDARSLLQIIEEEGNMPIPGYIRNGYADEGDKTRYQTVYSQTVGSVAAPTAGLHFTDSLFAELRSQGIGIEFITLHVGVASFAPVRDLQSHKMPLEWYRIPFGTARAIERTKRAGGRVIAVGTTCVRSLESSVMQGNFGTNEQMCNTELFITPGFSFSVVDSLMTNFHQPRTTHLLLVSAFHGEENVKALYQHALKSDYRFLSYGDSMLILSERK